MINNIVKKAFVMIIMSAMCIALFSFSTSAVSLDTRGSITLSTLDKETKEPISDALFRAYAVASIYEDDDGFTFVYTDEFRDNGMDMGDFSDAYLPVHLGAYAQSKSIPYTEKLTDSKGRVTFDNLTCGVYLIVPVGISEGYLNPTAFIVTVPMRDETQDKWVYNIDATPKIESDKDESDQKTYISVKKYWQSTEETPDSIMVSLLRDGEISESVFLSAANNWYHKWENLDKNHSWSVVESEVPKGYRVSYVASQMTVIITNTHEDYEDETTTNPDESTTSADTTTPDDITTTQPTTKPTGTTESTTKPEELIDTGQLNWPVPVFAIAGLLLFSIGWAMLNFGKNDEEAV